MTLERSGEESETLVSEIYKVIRWHQSRSGHVKPGLKQGGPPPKAKYYPVTDSE